MFGFFYFWKMQSEKEFEVIISEGKRSWYEIVLAALFFSVTAVLIVIFLIDAFVKPLSGILYYDAYRLAKYGVFGLGFGLRFSLIKDILIDTDVNKLVSRYKVGMFSYDVVAKIQEFEYVSVFKDDNEFYQTLLWYTGNKHYEMYSFDEEKPAFDFALNISNKLNIDLLDATVKGDFKWVDKTTL